MRCKFDSTKKGERCKRCGYELTRDYDRGPIRNCNGAVYFIDRTPRHEFLWGCRACVWMTITPTDEPPDHRCGQKECKHKGQPKGTVKVECCSGVDKLLTAHECAVHGRCLPSFQCHGAGLEKWRDRKPESDIYKLCCQCTDRED